MAELYEYLYEEIDMNDELLPCEFCGEPFPFSVFIEHSSGCRADLFAGVSEPENLIPDFDTVKKQTPVVDPEPVISFETPSKPSTNTVKENEKVLFPKADYISSIKIEQLVTNEVYDIKPKSDGGSVMKKLFNVENVESQKEDNSNDAPNSYIHFTTDIPEQGESDSEDDEDDEHSKTGSEQTKDSSSKNVDHTQGFDAVDPAELSDDYNEENETVESFLLRASLELSKIKQRNEKRAKAKWKESTYSSYDYQETYRQHANKNIYYQDCY